ncbi:MAG: anthranilate phosphoribosyltransferase [Candidatus Omnitrophota bacterium]
MNKSENLAIQEGIKMVGVGKKGSKSLDSALIEKIILELKSNQIPEAIKGAFFAGLIMKGPTPDELRLNTAFDSPVLEYPAKLALVLSADTPDTIQTLCSLLLEKQELTLEQATELGRFLMSAEKGDGARGMVASLLRVRYETADEYEGLLKSIEETFEPPFRLSVPEGKPVITVAEPFDGVDHSNMITPLITDFLRQLNYRVVSLVGRNSGPKFFYNLHDIARGLSGKFMQSNRDLAAPDPDFGWFLGQKDLSTAMDRWVDIRRQIIKRPFMATLERFVNPCQARIMIASAFHPPYGEKMLTLCERSGFPGAIIIRNGMEGTIAFPLMRQAKILCCARQLNGRYVRHEFMFDSQAYLKKSFELEERLDHPSCEDNIKLIRTFKSKGQTGYDIFDSRVKVTCAGLQMAIEWVELNMGKG